jgi:signal peptidase I
VTHGYQPRDPTRAQYWVPDLIVECTAEFGAATDTLTLELSKAGDRFQAKFDNGVCLLYRIRSTAADAPEKLGNAQTRIGAGRYRLRFANVDSRLTVWVDGKALDFGTNANGVEAANYEPPSKTSFEPTVTDVQEPARIGATGAVTVSKLSLWRDVYYTCYQSPPCGVQTFYVQPGHYFCLGDNSASSSDGREWGLVPERLVLGKAVVVYWPGSWALVGYVVAVIAAFAAGFGATWGVSRYALPKESGERFGPLLTIVGGILVAVVVAVVLYHAWPNFDPGRIGVIK